MSTWKRDFANGLVIIAPILVTLFVVSALYGFVEGVTPEFLFIDAFLVNVIDDGATRRGVAEILRVGLTLGILFALIMASGSLVRTTVGRLAERLTDRLANRLPGVRVIYNASKVGAETAFGEQDALQEPVKLETWNGLRMTAFKTGRATPDGREVLFLPTSPNITTGFVIETESDRIIELDESVEEALTRVLSAGFGDSDRSRPDMDVGVPIDAVSERSEGRRNTE